MEKDLEDDDEEEVEDDEEITCLSCWRTDIVFNGYCPRCANSRFPRCYNCGEWTEDPVSTESGLEYCENCAETEVVACDGCGDLYGRHEITTDYCCEECQQEITGLYDYGYRPEPVFHGIGNLYFGIELEVECVNCSQTDAVNVLEEIEGGDLFYCKADSSLSKGVEFVSHPMTWEAIVSPKYQAIFTELLDRLRTIGCKSFGPGTCGMHVHMSRKAFTKLHLFKYMAFVGCARPFVEKVAQRESNCFARITDYGISTLCLMAGRSSTGHYEALSLSSHCPTVEFRVFRGNLLFDRFMKNLEFCKAVYNFTQTMPAIHCQWRTESNNTLEKEFTDFLVKNKSQFPNLYTFLFPEAKVVEVSNATYAEISEF